MTRTPWNKGVSGYKTAPATAERKRKISAAQSGEKNHNFGRSIPEDVKAKIRAKICGSQCHLAKLTEASVAIIKQRLVFGESVAGLAKEYGVAPTQISAIKTGRTWKHVPLNMGILP